MPVRSFVSSSVNVAEPEASTNDASRNQISFVADNLQISILKQMKKKKQSK